MDFRPCGFIRPWLWSSERRTRDIRYHNELEWPENDGVGRHLLQQVLKTRIFTSPINFQNLISLPNAQVKREDIEAQKLAPSFYRLPTDNGFQILDNESEQLLVYLPQILRQAWSHPTPTHSDCTWTHLNVIVHAALDRLANKYPPDPKDCDKRYNPTKKPIKENVANKDPIYGTYNFSMWCGQGHGHEPPVLSTDQPVAINSPVCANQKDLGQPDRKEKGAGGRDTA